MADDISIAISADISGIEAGMADAVASVDSTLDGIVAAIDRANASIGQNQISPVTQKSADAAERVAQRIIEIQKQTGDKIIEGDAQLNAFRLKMGEETEAEFGQQALALAKDKYDADLAAARQEETNGKITHAQFLAEKELLDQEYANKVAAIRDQVAEKERESDEKAFAEFARNQEAQVKTVLDANAGKLKAGEIAASRQEQDDIAALDAAKNAVYQQFATLTAGWNQETDAYRAELDRRNAFDEWYAEEKKKIEDQTAREDAQTWAAANNEILSSEDSLVRDLLTKRRSLGLDLLQMTGQMIEKELAADLKYWTMRALYALEGNTQEESAEKGGLLVHLMTNLQRLTSTETSEAAQTAATVTGTAMRTSADKLGAVEGLAAQAQAGSAQIMNNAMVGASGAYSALASIPIVGPFLGAAAAAVTFAAIMAYDSLTSLDVGAWELRGDMPAMLHKGEMVVPQNFASGLRANGGLGGADGPTFNTHYSPTINMRDPTTLRELLQKGGAELFDAVQRGYRLGLPMRPSMSTW